MTKGMVATVVLWFSIAAPAAARDPLSKLPPVPKSAGASGELATRHRRVFAGGLAFTDPAHQHALEQLRGERRRNGDVVVERRPLARYDALIPA